MIPLRDNIPVRRLPLITVLLIVANIVVFALDQMTGNMYRVETPQGTGLSFVGGFDQYALVPASITSDLARSWPTVFTAMFLHGNWLHVGGNMLYLWIFGANLEDTLGRGRYLLFYLACGVAAAAAHVFMQPDSTIPLVGASGAIAGLMGAYLVLFPDAEILSVVPLFIISTIMEVPAILVIGYWAFLNFANAQWLGGGELLRGGGVAYFAHIGGFVAGIVFILILGGRSLAASRRRPQYETYHR